MAPNVKRGLGLLTVAVIALLVAIPANMQESAPGAVVLVAIAAGLVFVSALLCGLVLVAWGLLRD